MSQNSQESSCARVSFQAETCKFIKKKTLAPMIQAKLVDFGPKMIIKNVFNNFIF